MNLGLSGLASGFDWQTLISQLIEVERAPERRLRTEQSELGQKNTAYSNIVTELQSLQTSVKALNTSSLFQAKTTSVSNAQVATASAGTTAAAGTYKFTIKQLATSSTFSGTSNVGKGLSATDDVSGLVLSQATFARTVTEGTFTVNGKQITISSSDTLQQVFGKISAATGGSVTAAYTAASDKIILTGASEIVLGSATDTSNFLQVAKLANNGTGSVTSTQALGMLSMNATLANAGFATALNDGGAGQGSFKINGVAISFDAANDTLAGVLGRINESAAGVIATYDSWNDRVVLTNKSPGDMGIALEEVTGNFLTASGLAGGALARGKNMIYQVNDGPDLTAGSNTITEESSNITGLTLTVTDVGSTTVSVGTDSDKIKAAIKDFVTAYNKVQSLIETQTASSTDSKGTVTAGILAGESDADDVAWKLRGLVNATISSTSGTMQRLENLGITSNGNDNLIAISDEADLDAAIKSNLSGVQKLFTDSVTGIAVTLNTFLERTSGEEGTLLTRQDNINRQIASIDQQVIDMERVIKATEERLTASFVAMEEAQARSNQQLQFLSQKFGISS